MRVHFRRILITGLMPIGICLLMTTAPSPPGPGWYAVFGLALAGLLLQLGLYGLHKEPELTRAGRWLMKRAEKWHAAALVVLQCHFVSLCVLLLWFAVVDLGLIASVFHHALLIFILGLAPLRQVLHGTYSPDAKPLHEVTVEFLRYVNASAIAVFIASVFTQIIMPPGERFAQGLPPTLVLVWLPAVLVVLTSIILMIDHVLRKMPPLPATIEKDALD